MGHTFVIIFVAVMLLVGQTPPAFAQIESRPDVLIDLESAHGERLSEDERAQNVALRSKTQKDAALAAGISAGVKWRYQQILDAAVEPNRAELDALFNFAPLLITQGEVTASPPIITRAGAALRLGDDGIASAQKGSYKFVKSAQIITGVPTWRNYLYIRIPEPDELHPSILPVGGREVSRWRSWVNEGWKLGVAQAEHIFESNVAKLVRDYNGMLIYYGLAAEGMVEKPVIKETRTGTHIMAKEVIYDRNLYQVTKDGNFQKPPRKPVQAAPRKKGGAVADKGRKAGEKPVKRAFESDIAKLVQDHNRTLIYYGLAVEAPAVSEKESGSDGCVFARNAGQPCNNK